MGAVLAPGVLLALELVNALGPLAKDMFLELAKKGNPTDEEKAALRAKINEEFETGMPTIPTNQDNL